MFFRSDNGGVLVSLPTCVSTVLESGAGRWLRWVQETLGIVFYFSIFYGFICKASRSLLVSRVFGHVTWISINKIRGCSKKKLTLQCAPASLECSSAIVESSWLKTGLWAREVKQMRHKSNMRGTTQMLEITKNIIWEVIFLPVQRKCIHILFSSLVCLIRRKINNNIVSLAPSIFVAKFDQIWTT